jgi:hypothetical protein
MAIPYESAKPQPAAKAQTPDQSFRNNLLNALQASSPFRDAPLNDAQKASRDNYLLFKAGNNNQGLTRADSQKTMPVATSNFSSRPIAPQYERDAARKANDSFVLGKNLEEYARYGGVSPKNMEIYQNSGSQQQLSGGAKGGTTYSPILAQNVPTNNSPGFYDNSGRYIYKSSLGMKY